MNVCFSDKKLKKLVRKMKLGEKSKKLFYRMITFERIANFAKNTTVGLVLQIKTHFDKCQVSKSLKSDFSSWNEVAAAKESTTAKNPKQSTLPFKSSAREAQHEINLQKTRDIYTFIISYYSYKSHN